MSILKKVFTSEIKGIDEKEMTLTAYISTSTRDRMNEVLDPEGADLSNYKKNPVVLWAHDYSAPPIGKALWTKRDGEGVISKVKFASTAFAQEIFQLYKEGFLKAFSVGFMPKQTEDGDGEKKPRRTYKKWELLEFSAVPVPANPDALSLAIQKGILKTDSLKDSMGAWKDAEGEIEATAPQEEAPKEEPVAEEPPPEEPVKESGLDDLMAENKLLQDKIDAQAKEITALNYKIYELLNKKSEAKLPDITADALANMVGEVVGKAIRKIQGKVE